LKFDSVEAKGVFWHSSAHILGEAMELYYNGVLFCGPLIEEGFCCEIKNRKMTLSDLTKIESIMKDIVTEKQPFERLVIKKEDLMKMLEYNKTKQRFISESINTTTTTIYRCGSMIDVCKGPFIRHTGQVRAMSASIHTDGAESLPRIHGISFPDAKQLAEWQKISKCSKPPDRNDDQGQHSSSTSISSKEVGQRYITIYQFYAINSDELTLLRFMNVTSSIPSRIG
jgi:threonyl-tRNA synthetase